MFEPLIQVRLLFLLLRISLLRTVALLVFSRWKIWLPSQPPQSTVQPSTTMLLPPSERKLRALTGPTRLRLLTPPVTKPFSKSPTVTDSPAAVLNVTPAAPIAVRLAGIVTSP